MINLLRALTLEYNHQVEALCSLLQEDPFARGLRNCPGKPQGLRHVPCLRSIFIGGSKVSLAFRCVQTGAEGGSGEGSP